MVTWSGVAPPIAHVAPADGKVVLLYRLEPGADRSLERVIARHDLPAVPQAAVVHAQEKPRIAFVPQIQGIPYYVAMEEGGKAASAETHSSR